MSAKRVISRILAYPRSGNGKTGDVPTVAIGTQEARVESCASCALRPKVEGGDGRCYAREAQVRSVESGVKRGEASVSGGGKSGFMQGVEGFIAALANRSIAARMVRFGSVGDPSVWSPLEWAQMRAATLGAGLTPICYTSRWREPVAAHLRGQSMASCTSPQEAGEAVSQGWMATTILPADHPRKGRFHVPAHGAIGVVCLEQSGAAANCNACLLCDGTRTIHNERLPPLVVGFIDHSNVERGRANLVKMNAAKAAQLAANADAASILNTTGE